MVDTSAENAGSNVCLVVDHSGSMTGTNLEQAQRAVSSFIQTAGSKMKTGLVAFDDVAEMLCPMTESTGMVQRAVDNLTADGGTHIANGLVSNECLANQSGNRVIILLSDGEDSEESANQMDSVINPLKQGLSSMRWALILRTLPTSAGSVRRPAEIPAFESSEDLGSVTRPLKNFVSGLCNPFHGV
ncbi:MAG: vWA domain-containing protein [Hydrogeniiclostridium mannosilyticum]